AASLSVVVVGDESGYALTDIQKMKLALIEASWETHEPPAPFTLVGIPDREAQKTHFELQIPWAMGLIATRSLDQEVPGILELMVVAEDHIASGLKAYDALETLKQNPSHKEAKETFLKLQEHMGYALLLKK